MTQIISDPKEWNQLRCICGAGVFNVIIHITGVVCCCAKCNKKYKLESIGGLKISNA